ncbi:hypothetical protein HDU79_000321 [Rhizoclosmatium sp. JEL0117]|nr:hypothetical protein HDU79_000321 [Rhizoclosmatium sp. JEL0117]
MTSPIVPSSLLRSSSEFSETGSHNLLHHHHLQSSPLSSLAPDLPLRSPSSQTISKKVSSGRVSSLRDPPPSASPSASTGTTAKDTTASKVQPQPSTTQTTPKPSGILLSILLFRKVLLLNDGRDKSLKVLQYTAKVLLWVRFLSLQPLTPSTSKTLTSLIPHISLARKLVRLGNFLGPFEYLTTSTLSPSSIFSFLSNVNGLLTGIADDTATLGKLNIVHPAKVYQTWADRFWWIGILFDWNETVAKYHDASRRYRLLEENKRVLGLQLEQSLSGAMVKVSQLHVDGDGGVSVDGGIGHDVVRGLIGKVDVKLEATEKELLGYKLVLSKLVADFLFCSFDVFGVVTKVERMGGLKAGGRVMATASQLQKLQDVAGLTAAILGTYKLYLGQKL